MPYQVIIIASAQKELRAITGKRRAQIDARVAGLAMNPFPSGCKAMQGEWAGKHRIRSGNYRVIYEVSEAAVTVTIITVGSRGGVY